MPAELKPIQSRARPNSPINFSALERAFGFGILLCGLLSWGATVFAGEISRTYDYKGFDTNGTVLVKGVVTLRFDDSVQVKGNWTLKILDKNKLKELGPQDGSGKVTGQTKGDTIFLNFNPDLYDNNIYLDGKVSTANIFRITGKWGYYGFVGKVNEGNFEMVRKDPPKSNSH